MLLADRDLEAHFFRFEATKRDRLRRQQIRVLTIKSQLLAAQAAHQEAVEREKREAGIERRLVQELERLASARAAEASGRSWQPCAVQRGFDRIVEQVEVRGATLERRAKALDQELRLCRCGVRLQVSGPELRLSQQRFPSGRHVRR